LFLYISDEGLSGDRAKFVDTFWNILKWDEIEKRLAAAEKGISFIL
jgi:superoxide dismutase